MRKWFEKLFKIKSGDIDWENVELILLDSEKKYIQQFAVKNTDDRLHEIMALGDTGKMEIFRILQYAILHDPDHSVKFAALKRIHHFADHPSLEPMLLKMQNEKISNSMEPYFSMALNRLGI
jgi:hypothetical protein